MTNETMVIKTSGLSAEEIERRNQVRLANKEAAKEFIPAAIVEVANGLGIELEVFKELMPKFHDMTRAVEAKALAMFKEANKATSAPRVAGAPTPKWIGKAKASLVRSMVFAFNHNVKGEALKIIIEEALAETFDDNGELITSLQEDKEAE